MKKQMNYIIKNMRDFKEEFKMDFRLRMMCHLGVLAYIVNIVFYLQDRA